MAKYALELTKSTSSIHEYMAVIIKDDGIDKCVHDVALADNLDDLQAWFAGNGAGVEYAIGRNTWHMPDALTVWECALLFIEG